MLEDAEVYGTTTARYYDSVYEKLRDPVGDTEFYSRLAREAQGPILELGCGTGRVLLPVAAQGMPCTGLDVSPRMLAALRRKPLPPTLRLVCAPMQDFDLGEQRFMLIFAAFRVFQHLYSVEDQLAALACVRRHLGPGGRFAFDVFAPDLDRIRHAERPEVEDLRFEQGGESIVRYCAVSSDPARQILKVTMRYERRGDEGVDNEIVEVQIRYFFRYELEHLLARAGFEDVQITGGFDGREYDPVSGETVVVARRSTRT